jgi:7-cyano-7-deazaguanine tRNA-ribosyltransferase
MSFQVHGKDLLGRIGTIKTKSGAFATPHMFPVLDPHYRFLRKDFFDRVGIHAVMTNAYLLKRGRQGLDPVDVHGILDYPGTVATDSGAYQILEYGHVGVTPEEIVIYQEKINTDIGVILDVPTGFRSDPSRARWTVDETVRRADREMAKRDFAIYALGSPTELMETQRYDVLADMIIAAKSVLPKGKPFHLFGAGHPAIFPFLVALGCDLFDSAAYALYARAGRYLTPEGTQLLGDIVEFACTCPACVDSSPEEFMSSQEKEGETRLAEHNLWTCFSELRRIREAIRKGRLWELLELRSQAHPALKKCFNRIISYGEILERSTPAVKPHGIFYLGPSSDNRPEKLRFVSKLPRSVEERRKFVLVLPGRWRRPFHEDPRYESVAKAFDDHPRISICFYSLPWGPVPIELDETFPIAQTEGPDEADALVLNERAKQVSEFLESLHPRSVVLVSDGDYGRAVTRTLSKTFAKRMLTVFDGETMRPDDIVKSVEKKLLRDV